MLRIDDDDDDDDVAAVFTVAGAATRARFALGIKHDALFDILDGAEVVVVVTLKSRFRLRAVGDIEDVIVVCVLLGI